MKGISTAILLFVFLIALNAQSPRSVEDFNFGWKFNLGDTPEAKSVDFNDECWRVLNLPHDWSIEQNYTTQNTSGSTGFLPTGIGWYRKTFIVPEESKDKLTFIEFDGIYHHSEVWLNGHFLGKRPYGYSVFGYELTPYLKYGTENTVVVKVDHSNYADSRWYTGSGIYRNVRLITTSKAYVPQFGAWVETPEVSSKKAVVKTFAVIKSTSKQKLTVRVSIKDKSGKVVGSSSQRAVVSGIDTLALPVNVFKPKLWDIAHTDMYTANVQVYAGSKWLDDYQVEFGVRTFRFDANKGFFLNGKNLKLKGVCLHHDAGAVGGVFIKDVWKRRLQGLKDIGVNAIRMSHNPADPGLLKLCDVMGFVVINEALDEWRKNKDKWITSRFAKDMRPALKTGYGDIYEEWAEQDVKDMVRSSRNHPSIIMWSMGNEIEWTYPYYYKMEQSNQGLGNQVLVEETGDGRDELKETAEEIKRWIKEVDTTRYVTAGGVLPKAGNMTGYFDVPDVMGYNYRAVNYDEDHKNYPNRFIYGSENWGTYQEWKDAIDRDFVAGIFIWTGIAYLGESGPFPWKGLEISLMDFAGFYTPRGHFYKTLWNDEPSIYVATKHAKKAQWIFEDGKWVDNRVRFWLDKWLFEDVEPTWNYEKGDEVFVEVYSNSPEVELFVNGESYGVKSPNDFEDHIVKYLVPYHEGEIKAIGKDGDKETCVYSLKTAKWVSKIKLNADRKTMKANGYDVVHVEAELTNGNGDLVPDKKMQLVFEIEGEGVLIGVDNGWDRNVQPHKSNQIVTHNGKALLLIQSTQKAGEIKIIAKAGSLVSNEILVATE
ncbi:sugar-binding domain-containing protein [Saccharicrinis fermentans]|uniref:Beta-galactosidase n=1 Tax=Saccharicrinis fermentans DSM 9555 = JCM 21142 TaxID=869213 RepID=W7Y569_9BACT|nr:sugar-binding domain-containing protein [Saccharicrinis fermentans]GAF02698.1 beta-galactosidase [Saccharicrinis fermentans DSM 9555 = JCM 21142]